jgi:hypothetical protein
MVNAVFVVSVPAATPTGAIIDFVRGKVMEYKYRRDNWSTIETGVGGPEVANRVHVFGEGEETIRDVVLEWKDMR